MTHGWWAVFRINNFLASLKCRRWNYPIEGCHCRLSATALYLSSLTSIVYVFIYFYFRRTLQVIIEESNFPAQPQWPFAILQTYISNISIFYSAVLFFIILPVVLHKYRWIRILCFLALLQTLSIQFSNGNIYHGHHSLLFISFLFIFLPSLSGPSFTRKSKYLYATVFMTCQLYIAMVYTLSGFWKVFYLLTEYEIAPSLYLQFHIANEWLMRGYLPSAAKWFFIYPSLGYGHIGVAGLFLFTGWAVFQPKLHRVWGFLLILFHLSTEWILDVSFGSHIMLVGIFFCASPFACLKWNFTKLRMPTRT